MHSVGGDIAALPEAAIPPGTDVVFHLAAVVSAAAEADYELGRRVNVRGTDAVIDACRTLSAPPRLVFTSSVASFSGGQDAVLGDDARQIPANSYGAQKAAAELFLADATRRGFLDAVLIRLPTVIVRPGRPNKAASSFVSSILREPLLGEPADLPVPDDFAVWVCSPRRAVALAAARRQHGHQPHGPGPQRQPAGHARDGRRDACSPGTGPARRHHARPPRQRPGHRRHRRRLAGRLRARARRVARLRAARDRSPSVVQAFIEDDLAATKSERQAAG